MRKDSDFNTIPVGPLGLVPLEGCQELGEKVDAYLAEWRRERENEHTTALPSVDI